MEKDGTGLWQVWKRQIQQFNRVSPATAAAIAEAYPSPSLLLQVSPQTTLRPLKSLKDEGRKECRMLPRLKVFIDGANKPRV